MTTVLLDDMSGPAEIPIEDSSPGVHVEIMDISDVDGSFGK
jgi:hypothetical protein